MRLRVEVQRYRLPPAKVIWNVPATASGQGYTISRLLEDVNDKLPLEAEHWGLEDYVVEVDGFECLHFTPVAQAFKDDDEVVIRPLLTAEVRARTLSGRFQINGSGQHLVDGVPFGKPSLRNPSNRPQIRIPPAKRRRLLEDADAGADENMFAGLITAGGEMSPTQGSTVSATRISEEETASPYGKKRGGKTVHFNDIVAEDTDSDEDEDDDFDPNEVGAASDTSSDENSSEESGISSSDRDSESDLSTDSGSDSGADSDSDSESESDDDAASSSSSEDDNDSDKDSLPEVLPSKPISTKLEIPYRGKKSTRARNKRRQQSKKLHKLISSGILPSQSNLESVRLHLQQQKADDSSKGSQTPGEEAGIVKPSSKRKRGSSNLMPEEQLRAGAELEAKRKQLLADLSHDATLANDTEQQDSDSAMAAKPEGKLDLVESSPKRLRPDVSAIRRMVLAQTTPFRKRTSKTKPTQVEEPQTAPDPDYWKSKISVCAYECWDAEEDEDELNPPPFPFKQHWDPIEYPGGSKARGKKRKREVEEILYASAEGSETPQLDYGDPSTSTMSADTEKADIDTEAAIESQLREDVAIAAKSDVPPLPEDISSLPTLSDTDVRPGAIIVFKVCELNPTTMMPEITTYRTATVEVEQGSEVDLAAIKLRLAERDIVRKERKYDKKGKRVYSRADYFRMDDSENEEENDEGVTYWLPFQELLEPKLLRCSEEATEQTSDNV